MAPASLLAHAGEISTSGSGEIALTVLLVGVLVTIWTILGVVCWVFWRAKQREDREKEELWRNAPSS